MIDHSVDKKLDEAKILSGGVARTIKFTMKYYTKVNVLIYKLSRGKCMNTFPGGFPICLATIKGRKTGVYRDTPLLHIPFMDKKLLLASQGGLPTNPVWYFNIKAHPSITITVHGVTKPYTAVQLNDKQKAEYWPHISSSYPDIDMYAARTERNIPVFICSPASS